MSIVVVTSRCFLIAERITYITLQDRFVDNYVVKKKLFGKDKTINQPVPRCHISLSYDIKPVVVNNGYTPEAQHIDIEFDSKTEALQVFTAMVEQIREQSPDELYLDKLMERMLKEGGSIQPLPLKAEIKQPQHDYD